MLLQYVSKSIRKFERLRRLSTNSQKTLNKEAEGRTHKQAMRHHSKAPHSTKAAFLRETFDVPIRIHSCCSLNSCHSPRNSRTKKWAMEAGGGDAASSDRDGHVFHLDSVVHDSASSSYRDERASSSHASCDVPSSSSCLSSASSPSSCDEEACSCAWLTSRTTEPETWIASSSWSLTPLVLKVLEVCQHQHPAKTARKKLWLQCVHT